MTLKNLLNPFEKFSESKLFIVGLFAVCVATWLTMTYHLLYLGSLKIVNNYPKTWYIALLNVGITIGANTLVLYLFAILKNRKARIIDVLNTVLVAHISMFLLGLLLIVPLIDQAIKEVSLLILEHGFDATAIPLSLSLTLALFAMISLGFLVLFFYWIVVGIKVAINSKGRFDGFVIVLLVLLLNTLLQVFNPYF